MSTASTNGSRSARTSQRLLCASIMLYAISMLLPSQDFSEETPYVWQASLVLGCVAVLVAPRPRRTPAPAGRRRRAATRTD